MAGCSGASNMFSSDLLSKDADWFSRPGRVFIKNVSIETAPLTPDKPITPDDLITADGQCPGMAPPPPPPRRHRPDRRGGCGAERQAGRRGAVAYRMRRGAWHWGCAR